jgi:hypothetical protein
MGLWLLIIATAVTVTLWRLIGVAGVIWRERARVASHRAQMEAAALNGAILSERLPDGSTLIIMPESAGSEHDAVADRLALLREMTPR